LKQVKKILESQERSQAWLARKLNVSPALICYWMHPDRSDQPSLAHRLRMAEIFNVDVKDLFNNHQEKGE